MLECTLSDNNNRKIITIPKCRFSKKYLFEPDDNFFNIDAILLLLL